MDVGIPDAGPLLAVDWGERHIGIAVSDTSQTFAHPVTTLSRRTGRRFPMRQLRQILDEREPVGIVMGLPLQPDGSEGDRCREVRDAGELIASKTQLPVAYIDERMSTARAHAGRLEQQATSPHAIDAVAAAVILRAYLETRR